MKKVLFSLLSLSLCSSILCMNDTPAFASANTDDNFEIINLPPERWQEFKELRLQAVEEAPVSIGVTRDDEQARSEDAYAKFLEKSAGGEFTWSIFAQRNNKLIGMAGAMCTKSHLSTMRHVATVISVYTKPEFRRMGIATALMKALLTKLEKSNVMQAQLQVTINPANDNDQTAIKVYQRLGFKQCGTYSNDIVVNGKSYSSVIMERGIEEKPIPEKTN